MIVYEVEYNIPTDWNRRIIAKDKDTAEALKNYLEKYHCFNIRITEKQVIDWNTPFVAIKGDKNG